MPPSRPNLVELLADTAAARLNARSRGSEVRDPKVNVRGNQRLAGCDPLEREPWAWPLAEDEVGTLVHSDRLFCQLAVEPAQSIGAVTGQCDVREFDAPIVA